MYCIVHSFALRHAAFQDLALRCVNDCWKSALARAGLLTDVFIVLFCRHLGFVILIVAGNLSI